MFGWKSDSSFRYFHTLDSPHYFVAKPTRLLFSSMYYWVRLKRTIKVNEGVMIAFSSKFKLVSNEYNVRVSDLLQKELYPENNDIINYLSQSDDTCEDISLTPTKSSSNQILRSRPTVLQVTCHNPNLGERIIYT